MGIERAIVWITSLPLEQVEIQLIEKLSRLNVTFWCTDHFKAYNVLPIDKSLIGKIFTQRIERENLTF
ncbi:IS1 family transposase [Xenorhabdus sp. PB30.3]|nr:IS1 family transposase [Xenorhabdus sp. PB30.3]